MTSQTQYYQQMAESAATQAGINAQVFLAQINQESGFNPNALSSAGAEGIAQFMPATAQSWGINPYDPTQALPAAAQLDQRNLSTYGGDWSKALAAYNCGGGCVNNLTSQYGSNWLSHAPAQTQNYVSSILSAAGQGTNQQLSSNTSNQPCTLWGIIPVAPALCNNGGDPSQQIQAGAGQALTNSILGPIEQWLPGAAERVGLFLFALILVVVGFMTVSGKV